MIIFITFQPENKNDESVDVNVDFVEFIKEHKHTVDISVIGLMSGTRVHVTGVAHDTIRDLVMKAKDDRVAIRFSDFLISCKHVKVRKPPAPVLDSGEE